MKTEPLAGSNPDAASGPRPARAGRSRTLVSTPSAPAVGLAALLPLAFLVACTGAPPDEESTPEAARDAVEQVQTAVTDAGNREDLDAVMEHYTDASVLLPPDGAIIRGRAAIRQHFEGVFEATDTRIGIEPSEIRISGELAYSTGRAGGVVIDRESGDTTSVFTRYLMVLERGAGDPGRWTILRWMWQAVDPA